MSNHPRRRVVVLRDFSYIERPGEEELAIERFLNAAPPHIDVSVQPPEFIQVKDSIEKADVLISFGLKNYPANVLDWVLEHPRHIHVEQDWWEPTQPNADYRNRVIESSVLTLFSSPMHMERYTRIYDVHPRKASVIPFPVFDSDFVEPEMAPNQEDAVLWYAPWHPDYGTDLMIAWAKKEGQQVHASGLEVPKGEITQKVKGIGPISLDVAAPTICEYSRFIYFPRKPIPFGFTFFLAYLHGLEVTYSGEIGCMSWHPEITSLDKQCLRAADDFWNVVEEVAA